MLLVTACNCTEFARVHFNVGPLEEIKFDENNIGVSNGKLIFFDDEYNIYILLQKILEYSDKQFYIDTEYIVIPGKCLKISLNNPSINYSFNVQFN